jgi:hypothetical protein
MANLDTIILNASGQTVRTDIESNLQALKSNNSTASTPSGDTLTSYMSWANTNTNQYQIHNSAAFLPVLDISTGSSAGTHIAKPGTSAIPGYRFLNSSGSAVQSGMGLPADTRLGFFISGLEKTSILSDGKVGIGTTAPAEMLQVDGGGAIITNNTSEAYLQIHATDSNDSHPAYLDLASNYYPDYAARFMRTAGGASATTELVHRGTGIFRLNAQDGGTIEFNLGDVANSTNATRWKFDSAGAFKWAEHTGSSTTGAHVSGDFIPRVLIGKTGNTANATTSNGYNWYWTGSAMELWVDHLSQGTVTTSSDYRIKKDITTQTASGIDKIKQLRPVNYEFTDNTDLLFKGDGVKREGFIAHEVAEVIPSAVDGEKDAANQVQSLRVDAIVSVLTKALQEAVAKIETLEAKVAALEAS